MGGLVVKEGWDTPFTHKNQGTKKDLKPNLGSNAKRNHVARLANPRYAGTKLCSFLKPAGKNEGNQKTTTNTCPKQ